MERKRRNEIKKKGGGAENRERKGGEGKLEREMRKTKGNAVK